MNKVVSRKQKISLFSFLFVILLFVGFRYQFGNVLFEKLEKIESGYLVDANNGISLNQIPQTNLASNIGGSKSTLLTDFNFETLNGGTGIKTTDPRSLAMRKFLQDYNSPMYPYSDVFISEAKKYGLDWRLVASISGVESAFGNLIPSRSNNGWGWRGGPGGDYSMFPTWKEGIQTVTRGLAQGYGTNVSPFQIEVRYCPPCYANPYHAWANGVTKFMNELDYYYVNLEKL